MTYIPQPTPSPDLPSDTQPPAPRRRLGCALEIVETLVLTLVIYLVIHNFVAQPFEVEQQSMVPTVNPGEYVLIDKISPHFQDYERGDIVVFQPPEGFGQGGVPFIKRVIGLPGDTVSLENGRVFVTPPGGSPVRLDESYIVRAIDGGPAATLPKDADGTRSWTIATGTYFVMGDNRPDSQDSRFFGPIDRELVVGRAWLRYFPLDRIGFVTRPTYDGLSGWEEVPSRPIASYAVGSSATIQASIARP
ncbi:MAG: signal peptidase I [Chloroflexota bacterium]|nr:signal peptidase I [Chloroflexota bacterium]